MTILCVYLNCTGAFPRQHNIRAGFTDKEMLHFRIMCHRANSWQGSESVASLHICSRTWHLVMRTSNVDFYESFFSIIKERLEGATSADFANKHDALC